MISRVTGFIPVEETLKVMVESKDRLDALINSSHIFSCDHNLDSGEQQPHMCNCSHQGKLEENVSILSPCNSCGNMKIVGRVLRIPSANGLVEFQSFYAC